MELRQIINRASDDIQAGEIKFCELVVKENCCTTPTSRWNVFVMRGRYVKVTPGATKTSSRSPLLTSAAFEVQ